MQQMDSGLTGPPLYRPANDTLRQRKYLACVIFISALFHCVLIALLVFPAPPKPASKNATVKAVLFTPQPPEANSPSAPDAPRSLPEPVPEDKPTEQKTVATVPADTTQPDTSESTIAPDAMAPQETSSAKPTLPSDAFATSPGDMLTQAKDSPAPASRSIAQSVAAAVASQQQQLQNGLAREQAQQHRKALISPDLRIGEYVPPAPKVGEYNINCDKGINSALAIVAGVLGGNVKCTQRNEFQQFIDKRQHKPKQ